MANFTYDLGIIGGGAAGLTIAAGAARLGVKTVLVEREARLGGDCLHHGCVPSKALIHAARLYHHLDRLPQFGLPPVNRPPVEFRQVRARIQRGVATIQEHDSDERFCRLGVRVVFGPARFTDEHTVSLGGNSTRLTAAKWVVATGSSPALPPIPGLHEAGCLTNREIFSLDRLPSALVVLGGGPIAVELAQAFQRLGSQVYLLQRSQEILSREDADLAGELHTILEGEGMRIHTGATILRVEAAAGRRRVIFRATTGREEAVEGDAILVALGRRANTTGLGLAEIGITADARGIRVDRRLRTGQHHIFAAGDVTGSHLFTHAAGYEGGIVLSNAVFRLPRKVDYRWLPRCLYTDPELAVIGPTEKELQHKGEEYRVWTEEFAANDRAVAGGEGRGRIKLLLDRKGHPLGAQILGPHAGELLAPWITAMTGKVKLATLAAAVHPYPTLAEINKRVAGAVMAEKLFSAPVKKALAFFFNTKGRACEPEDHAP